MPRLEKLTLEIKTGAHGFAGRPEYAINGFEIGFDEVTGGTGPGETLVATGYPQSFPHNLVLMGPTEAEWDIDSIQAQYECSGDTPYEVRLGAITLDTESNLNIWYQRPAKVIDV
jgi:hypothetical protein